MHSSIFQDWALTRLAGFKYFTPGLARGITFFYRLSISRPHCQVANHDLKYLTLEKPAKPVRPVAWEGLFGGTWKGRTGSLESAAIPGWNWVCVSTSLCVAAGSVPPPSGTCVLQQGLWGVGPVNDLHQLVQHHGNVRLHVRAWGCRNSKETMERNLFTVN